MEIERKVTVGEIFAALSYIVSVTIACVFAFTFLVGDVEQTKTGVNNNAQAINEERSERIREDERISHQFEKRTEEIREEMKASEDRTRFLLEDIRENINILVKDRLQNGK